MENARPPEPTGSAEVTSNEVKFSGIKSDEVLSDWDGVFRSFNLDPEAFYITEMARDVCRSIRPLSTECGGWRSVFKRK